MEKSSGSLEGHEFGPERYNLAATCGAMKSGADAGKINTAQRKIAYA